MLIQGESEILKASEITGVPLIANCVMEDVDVPEGSLKVPELLKMSRKIRYAY